MNEFEFEIGDEVTFNSYGKKIPAKVKDRWKGNKFFKSTPDDRCMYRLTGTDPKKPLISECSGKSIIESKHFEE